MSAANEKLATDLCNALLTREISRALPYLSEDVFYHNVPWEPVTGHAGVRKVLEPFLAYCVLEKMDIKNTVSAGDVAMNERVETWSKGNVRVLLPVVGIFTIKEGKIVRWCDYFDAGTIQPLLDALKQP
ncbi:MAG: limonene-1,2-epoxide hydrolase family protein [Candidatus Binatia bacterium]